MGTTEQTLCHSLLRVLSIVFASFVALRPAATQSSIMHEIAASSYCQAILSLGVIVWTYRWLFCNLPLIPTVGGPSWPIASYRGALNLLHNGRDIVSEGYSKFKGGIFKIAMPDQWMVLIAGPQLVEELRRMPDDSSSFYDAAIDFFELDASFGPELKKDPFHVALLRGQLTRNLGNLFPDIVDEIERAFDDVFPALSHEWTSTPLLLPMAQKVIARVSNRAFVGPPMCRNDEYLELAIRHSEHVAWTRKFLILFPRPFKYLVAYFTTRSRRNIQQGQKLLLPLIQERIRIVGNNEKDTAPQDMLQWITEAALAKNQGIEGISRSLFATNWAAIHTSSATFTHALFDMASHPECVEELRSEVERVIGEEGWTKDAMNKLWKVDSFMRESLRMNGMSAVSLFRKTRKEIKFSNGARVPAGTIIVAVSRNMHMDEEYYPDPETFDPLRSYRRRTNGEAEVEGEIFSSYSSTHLHFGLGKHACPGRFFAALELKAMIAYVLLTYDLKLEDGIRPPNRWYALSVFPASDVRLLVRKRLQ